MSFDGRNSLWRNAIEFSTNYAPNQDWKVQCSASCLLDENNIENVNQQSQDIDNSSCNVQTDISRNEVAYNY